ncbi:MAG: MBL fold metallo-hydrolase [Cyanobacteriota bacterium]
MELKLDNISIEGVSRSTIETYFNIKELKLCFDIGKCPFHITPVPNIFLSHMHGDHAYGVYYYISHRNLAKMENGRIYLPEEALKETESVIKSYSNLEHASRNYELIPLTNDEEFEYGRDYLIKTFETDHRIPSLGYLVSQKKTKLKQEFLNKPQSEIIELKRKGIEITNTIYEPFITYLGDSTIKPVDEFDFIKKSKILIMECTFLIPEHFDQAEERKHIHIKNIIDRASEFENKYIILTHFSMRYTDNFIREYIRNILPENLREKVFIFF